MEDIQVGEELKLLENYIKLIDKGYCEDCNELCNIYGTPAFPSKAIAKAIEHLIKEYKKYKNIARKEYDEHMEKKRQNGVLENNQLILQREIEKKDTIIEEMAKYIGEIDVSEILCDNDICHESDNCNECIIEYFKNKIQEEK